MKDPPQEIYQLIDAWKSPQVKLPEVVRWKKYIDKDEGTRPQNTLQHSHSIVLLGSIVLEKLRPYVDIDGRFVLTALNVHDIGEGEVGMDTLYFDKNVSADLQEYVGFRKLYEILGQPVFDYLNKAFLLQFALKNPPEFPEDARKVMDVLSKENKLECLIFEALERFDYILYAMEQYLEKGNRKIAVQTLRNQIPHLDRLSGEIPGFRETVWTNEISEWCKNFIEFNKDIPIEQKGEI